MPWGWWVILMFWTLVAASPVTAGGYCEAFDSLPEAQSEPLKLLSKDDWSAEEREAFLGSTKESMDLLVDAGRRPFQGWGTPLPVTPDNQLDYLTPGVPLSLELFAERVEDDLAGASDFLLAMPPDARRVFSSPMSDQIRMGRALDRSVARIGSFAEAISPGFERMAETSTRLTTDSLAFVAACDVVSRGDAAIADHIDPSNGQPFDLRRESDDVFEIISGLTLRYGPFGLRVGDPSNARL
jgi:hypothetical protein